MKKLDDKTNKKIIAILYLFCSICWIISAIINMSNNSIISFIHFALAIVWFSLSIYYFDKTKRRKK